MPIKVKVVEREQQIAIQQQEIQRKEKELNSKVRVYLIFLWLKCNSERSLYSAFKVRAPAEAEKYRLEKIAEAEKSRTVLEAEAEVTCSDDKSKIEKEKTHKKGRVVLEAEAEVSWLRS